MTHLVLSLDYEIFGNGSGDVRRNMIEPTDRLLTLCDRYGAKVTIMFEVGEYWAIRKAEETGRLHLDYSPSRQIEEQIQRAVKGGHDVQLHLHPWWVGAAFKDDGWQLCPQYRRISDLPHGEGSAGDVFSVVGALCEGKRTLEALVRPIRAEYECLVYRAAMFWGQPSEELIRGLRKAGLAADSSVVRGLYETAPVPTDYRQAESAAGYWWTSAHDIGQPGPRGQHIVEFPVYSWMRPYVCNFRWTKLCVTLKRRQVEQANTHGHGMMEARQSTESPGTILKRLGSWQPFKYDFCKLSARDMIRGLRRVMKGDRAQNDGLGTPVVMLGHSKDFWNDRNLETFLKLVKTECDARVGFSTLGELTRRIVEKDAKSAEDDKFLSLPAGIDGCVEAKPRDDAFPAA